EAEEEEVDRGARGTLDRGNSTAARRHYRILETKLRGPKPSRESRFLKWGKAEHAGNEPQQDPEKHGTHTRV
ncbi:MAG TPA: hypothetical protein VFF73_21800, partial [Planctomycetota bacterium]|nr:hypothetical protein [Planctomycetota bacterium]